MPASIELFNQVTSPATKVYLDTNFIIRLKISISRPTEKKYKVCRDFYNFLRKNNVLNFTSIFAVQEAFYVGLFKFGIKVDMGRHTDYRGKKYNDVMKFKKEKPQLYQQLYQQHVPKVYDMWNFINNLGLNISYPRPFITKPTSSISHRISNYARLLLEKYTIEPSDAFHVAIARCLKIKHIVTCDQGFQQVDGIHVYTPS